MILENEGRKTRFMSAEMRDRRRERWHSSAACDEANNTQCDASSDSVFDVSLVRGAHSEDPLIKVLSRGFVSILETLSHESLT